MRGMRIAAGPAGAWVYARLRVEAYNGKRECLLLLSIAAPGINARIIKRRLAAPELD